MSLQPIQVNNKELVLNRYHSNLKIDYTSGISAITVYSISQFAVNQILCIGEFGSEGSEIIQTHATTSPTGFTITLASATTKPHHKDCPVYIIAYDQIEFSNGAKTVLVTSNIDPEMDVMTYEDSVNTSGYYFTRYVNSIGPTYSDYSDGVPFTGFPTNTVGYAIDTAMNELDAKFSEKLTYSMCIGFAKQMLALVRGKLKKWSKYQKYNEPIETVSQGVRSYAMPSDIFDKDSDRSIINLKVGHDIPLTYIDRSEYIQATEDVVYTEVAEEAVAGQTYLTLDDTSDLDDTGSIDVYVSGVKYTIEYTKNVRYSQSISPSKSPSISPSISPSSSASSSISPSASPSSSPSSSASPSASPSVSPSVSIPNTLIVDSDQITITLPVNTPVWQNIEEGKPDYFSVWDGNIYLWPMISSSYEGLNLTMDYMTEIETINSDMDVIQGTKFDMLIPYLKYKIRAVIENNGKENLQDPSNLEFRELLSDAIKNDGSAEIDSFRPRNSVIYGGRKHNSRR